MESTPTSITPRRGQYWRCDHGTDSSILLPCPWTPLVWRQPVFPLLVIGDVVSLAQGIPFALWSRRTPKKLFKEDSVRMKKPKTPRRLIRYLLSADQRLRKISLSRISVR